MFKSVLVSLCKYDTTMTNTRIVYFSCYHFVYNIHVEIFLKICWKKCIRNADFEWKAIKAEKLYIFSTIQLQKPFYCLVPPDSKTIFAANWFKMYKILQFLQLFFQNQPFILLLQFLQLSSHSVLASICFISFGNSLL